MLGAISDEEDHKKAELKAVKKRILATERAQSSRKKKLLLQIQKRIHLICQLKTRIQMSKPWTKLFMKQKKLKAKMRM